MLDGLRLARDDGGHELNYEFRVPIARDKDSREDCLDLHAQFFAKFPACCVEIGFSGLDLSPGEFPESAMSFVAGSLTYEIPTTLTDHGRQYSFQSVWPTEP